MKTLKQRFIDVLKRQGEHQTNFTSDVACETVADELMTEMNKWGDKQQNKFGDVPGVVSEEHYKQILNDQHEERRHEIEENIREGRLEDNHGWV